MMNNMLYNRILNSINREIESLISEQFNIGNMNLDNNSNNNFNIFNKEIINP